MAEENQARGHCDITVTLLGTCVPPPVIERFGRSTLVEARGETLPGRQSTSAASATPRRKSGSCALGIVWHTTSEDVHGARRYNHRCRASPPCSAAPSARAGRRRAGTLVGLVQRSPGFSGGALPAALWQNRV
jgi:hypothetical protein